MDTKGPLCHGDGGYDRETRRTECQSWIPEAPIAQVGVTTVFRPGQHIQATPGRHLYQITVGARPGQQAAQSRGSYEQIADSCIRHRHEILTPLSPYRA